MSGGYFRCRFDSYLWAPGAVDRFVVFVFPPIWNGVTTAPFGCSFANNILINVIKKEDVFLLLVSTLWHQQTRKSTHWQFLTTKRERSCWLECRMQRFLMSATPFILSLSLNSAKHVSFLAFSKVAPAFQKHGEFTAPHRCSRLMHGKQGAGIASFQPKRMWKHWQGGKQSGRTDTHSFQKTATNNPFLICVGLPWTDRSRIPRYSVSTLVKTKRKLTNS